MSRTANCPSCGAPVQFRWSNAIQTTCPYCQSILVRHDVDLKLVGKVADLPYDASPLQLGSEGVYANKAFQVTGRIVYEYEQGSWNEWHLIFNDSSSGWLSDAQLEYAVTFQAPPPGELPDPISVNRSTEFSFNGVVYQVTSITRAHYAGVEGELPFEYWDKSDVVFADLRSRDGQFGTIDYSENPALLFVGQAVEFDELKLTNLRRFEGWS